MDTTLPRKYFGVAATLGTTFGMFALWAIQGIVVARVLGPEQRGQFAAAVLFPQMLLYLGMLGAQELFAGYAARGMPNAPLRRSAAVYGLVAGMSTMLVCVALSWLTIPSGMRFVLPLAAVCTLAAPLQQIRMSVQAVDHGQREFTRYNWVRLLATASFPIALLVGSLCFNFHDLKSVCFLFVIAHFVSLLLIQFGMDEPWIGPKAVPFSRAFRDARGLIAGWFATVLIEGLDLVLLMMWVADAETLGYYAAAGPIAGTLNIVPHTAGLYVFNRGARDGENLSRHDVWKLIGLGLLIQVVCASLLGLVLPWIIPLLYGADFAPMVPFAWALLVVGVLRSMLIPCDSYLRARKRPGVGVRARVLAVPLLIGISWFGLPSLGPLAIPTGAAVAQAVCFSVMLAAIVSDSRAPTSSQSSPSASVPSFSNK